MPTFWSRGGQDCLGGSGRLVIGWGSASQNRLAIAASVSRLDGAWQRQRGSI